MGAAKVYIVRHGETQANRDGIIQGQLDTDLNDPGLQQAQLVASALKHIPFTAAFSSDLQRARKTAEAILEHHPEVELVTSEQLRERWFGELEGRVHNTIPYDEYSGATVENISTLEARGINWWKSTLLNHIRNIPEQQSPAHILVVSHGAFIATLVKGLLGARHIGQDAPGFKISRCLNTAICEIEVDDTLKGKLVKWGDIEHLLKPVVESNPDE